MRIALGVEYVGTAYHGFQFQKGDLPTIQKALESALSTVAAQPIQIVCAGRTDAGVHASYQIIHFDSDVERPDSAWVLGTNANLPYDIRIRWMKQVDDDFHARFSAESRTYHYIIENQPIQSAIMRNRVTWLPTTTPLDPEKMASAAQHLIGEHDFSAFRSTHCQAKTPFRNMHEITITKNGSYLVVKLKANAFLHNMVRNIIGVLVEVGTGRKEPIWSKSVLESRDRTQSAAKMPASGLYLTNVCYPEACDLPKGDGFLSLQGMTFCKTLS